MRNRLKIHTIIRATCIMLAGILSGGMLMTGCKSKTTVGPETENTIRFDTLFVNKQYHLLGDSTHPYCTLESTFIFPADYKDKLILDKLNRHFVQSFFGEDSDSLTPYEAMEQYEQKYITDYRELENDFIEEAKTTGKKPSQESWYAYFEMSSNEILYNKCNLISYTVSVEYYTGGAHGGHGYNNYVLSLQTGEALEEETIFIPDYQNELAQILVDAIVSANQVTNPEELEKIGYFNTNEIYPNDNFYINEDGITYTFNEYEIAAYHVGKIDVFLPYESIRHLMREKSPVAPLVFPKK